MSVHRCRLIDLPSHDDPRGALTFIEGARHVPFAVQRVYYLYDVPAGEARGSHAHRALEQLFIAITGAFDITLDDGEDRLAVRLDSPRKGLYVPPMLWRDLDGFSAGSVCLVLASAPYAESDYIRSYPAFLAATGRAGR